MSGPNFIHGLSTHNWIYSVKIVTLQKLLVVKLNSFVSKLGNTLIWKKISVHFLFANFKSIEAIKTYLNSWDVNLHQFSSKYPTLVEIRKVAHISSYLLSKPVWYSFSKNKNWSSFLRYRLRLILSHEKCKKIRCTVLNSFFCLIHFFLQWHHHWRIFHNAVKFHLTFLEIFSVVSFSDCANIPDYWRDFSFFFRATRIGRFDSSNQIEFDQFYQRKHPV